MRPRLQGRAERPWWDQGRVITRPVTQVIVDELNIEVELADVLRLKAAELELEDHVAVQLAMVKEQVDEEPTLPLRIGTSTPTNANPVPSSRRNWTRLSMRMVFTARAARSRPAARVCLIESSNSLSRRWQ
jgi:hypothetical protein